MMHAEADAGSRKSSSKHIEVECPPKKLRTSKAEQKSIQMIAHQPLTEDLERRCAIIQRCSSVQHLAPPVLGRSLGEQG